MELYESSCTLVHIYTFWYYVYFSRCDLKIYLDLHSVDHSGPPLPYPLLLSLLFSSSDLKRAASMETVELETQLSMWLVSRSDWIFDSIGNLSPQIYPALKTALSGKRPTPRYACASMFDGKGLHSVDTLG